MFKGVKENIKITEDEIIPSGYEGLDIGPKTINLFGKHIKNADKILWNGPMRDYLKMIYFQMGQYQSLNKFLKINIAIL